MGGLLFLLCMGDRKVEENEAIGMSYCKLRGWGGWVGGRRTAVGGGGAGDDRRRVRVGIVPRGGVSPVLHSPIHWVDDLERVGGWVGGWVEEK